MKVGYNTRVMPFAVSVGRSRAPHTSVFPYPLAFDTLAHTWVREKSQPVYFQSLSHTCRQNTRVRGRCSHRALGPCRSGGTYATLCRQPGSTTELNCSPLVALRSLPSKFPRINSYKSVSKQTTLTTFRMNTYTKTGEGAGPFPRCFVTSSLHHFVLFFQTQRISCPSRHSVKLSLHRSLVFWSLAHKELNAIPWRSPNNKRSTCSNPMT